MAEALVALGRSVELQLVRGSLSRVEADRAASARLAVLAAAAPTMQGAVVVVDLPDPNEHLGINPGELVVFDDGDRFGGRAAIVVQPSQETWSGPGHADIVLAGAAFAPIAAAFRRLRTAGMAGRDPGEESLVVASFGGSDPGHVGERLLPALESGPGWRTELIVGATYEGMTDGWPVAVVHDPGDLAEHLAAADLLVLGAGTMKFEAACLGRPAILVAVADDQLAVGPSYAELGAAIYLGDGRTVELRRVRAAIEDLLRNPERREALGRRAAEIVDGRGAERIAGAIARLPGGGAG